MNLQGDDLSALEHEAEFKRHWTARKVAREPGLQDRPSVTMGEFKRSDGMVVFLLRLGLPFLDGGEPLVGATFIANGGVRRKAF